MSASGSDQIAFFTNTLYRKIPGLILGLHALLADKVWHHCVYHKHDEPPLISLYLYIPLILTTCWLWEFWHATLHCTYVANLSHKSWWIRDEQKLCHFISNTTFCIFSATISTLAFIALSSISPQTNLMMCLFPTYPNGGIVLGAITATFALMMSSIEIQFWPQEVNSEPKEDTPLLPVKPDVKSNA